VLHHRHHFGVLKEKISPYVVPGDPKSGVLPRVSAAHPGKFRRGRQAVQAYCYRMCYTTTRRTASRFAKPEGYDPKQYELLRASAAGWGEFFGEVRPDPESQDRHEQPRPVQHRQHRDELRLPRGELRAAKEIIAEHETYQKGWLYFIANDPRVPKDVQEEMQVGPAEG
jgi:hypothetical protein